MNFSNFRRRMSAVVAAGFVAGTMGLGASEAQASVYEWNIVDTFFYGGGLAAPGGADLNLTFQFDTDKTGSDAFSILGLTFTGTGSLDSLSFPDVLGSSPLALNLGISGNPDFGHVLSVGILPSFAIGALGQPAQPNFTNFSLGLKRCLTASCIGANSFILLEGQDATVTSFLVPPSAVPLPASLPLFGTGLAIMGYLGWRRKSKAAAA